MGWRSSSSSLYPTKILPGLHCMYVCRGKTKNWGYFRLFTSIKKKIQASKWLCSLCVLSFSWSSSMDPSSAAVRWIDLQQRALFVCVCSQSSGQWADTAAVWRTIQPSLLGMWPRGHPARAAHLPSVTQQPHITKVTWRQCGAAVSLVSHCCYVALTGCNITSTAGVCCMKNH